MLELFFRFIEMMLKGGVIRLEECVSSAWWLCFGGMIGTATFVVVLIRAVNESSKKRLEMCGIEGYLVGIVREEGCFCSRLCSRVCEGLDSQMVER